MLSDDRDDDEFEVWPENWRTLVVFFRCTHSLQLVIGPGGGHYCGNRPESLETVMRMSRVPRAEREEMLDHLQMMEAAALPVLNEKRG